MNRRKPCKPICERLHRTKSDLPVGVMPRSDRCIEHVTLHGFVKSSSSSGYSQTRRSASPRGGRNNLQLARLEKANAGQQGNSAPHTYWNLPNFEQTQLFNMRACRDFSQYSDCWKWNTDVSEKMLSDRLSQISSCARLTWSVFSVKLINPEMELSRICNVWEQTNAHRSGSENGVVMNTSINKVTHKEIGQTSELDLFTSWKIGC